MTTSVFVLTNTQHKKKQKTI